MQKQEKCHQRPYIPQSVVNSLILLRQWRAPSKEIGRAMRWQRASLFCRRGAKVTILTLALLFQDQGLASMQLFTFSFLWCLFGFAVAIKTILTGTLPRLTSSMPLVCPVSWWWSTFRALSTQVSVVPEQLILSCRLVDSIVV